MKMNFANNSYKIIKKYDNLFYIRKIVVLFSIFLGF